jgi:hypothetical protein
VVGMVLNRLWKWVHLKALLVAVEVFDW